MHVAQDLFTVTFGCLCLFGDVVVAHHAPLTIQLLEERRLFPSLLEPPVGPLLHHQQGPCFCTT